MLWFGLKRKIDILEIKTKKSFQRVKKTNKKLKREIRELRTKLQPELRYELTKPLKPVEARALNVFSAGLKNQIKSVIVEQIELGRRTTDIYDLIVNQQRLCKKTAFYTYLREVRTELQTGLRTIKEIHK